MPFSEFRSKIRVNHYPPPSLDRGVAGEALWQLCSMVQVKKLT